MIAHVHADGIRRHVVRDSPCTEGERLPLDAVLVDAPCSTEGRFRLHDPETTRYWSPRTVREMQSKQRRLFFGAVQEVRLGPSGPALVYHERAYKQGVGSLQPR